MYVTGDSIIQLSPKDLNHGTSATELGVDRAAVDASDTVVVYTVSLVDGGVTLNDADKLSLTLTLGTTETAGGVALDTATARRCLRSESKTRKFIHLFTQFPKSDFLSMSTVTVIMQS